MKKSFFFLLGIFIAFLSTAQEQPKKVIYAAADGLKISADLYDIADQSAPLILLFHQAGYSRGEYKEIAPKLNKMGFRCLAVDQRSGNNVNGVDNETAARAANKKLPTNYTDAFPDLEASLKFGLDGLKAEEIIVWGSSYSASLVFILANKYPEKIKGLLSFSPGEYFELGGLPVTSYARKIQCSVFVTSSKSEKGKWEEIYAAIPEDKVSFVPTVEGFHGSKALWKSKKGNKEYWEAVKAFLSNFK